MGDPIKFPKAVVSRPFRGSYEFGPFRLDVAKRLLFRDGRPLTLTPRLFETLLVLVENNGRLVGKDELMTKLWPDTVVEEANLTVNVSALRKALGESTKEHRYIVTVPGRGYRFVADVKEGREEEPRSMPEMKLGAQTFIEEQTANFEADKSTPWLSEPAPARASNFVHSHKILLGSLLLAVTFALVCYLWLSSRHTKGDAGAGFKSIAVLPFRILNGSDNGRDTDEYLGIGMTDALITRLSGLKRVSVRPTSAVLKYNRAGVDPVTSGRELEVDAVLEGSIRKAGDTVRVTVQLVSVQSGAQLWASKFDEKASDVFTVEDRVSARVSEALTLNLTGDEKKRLAKRYTENTEAYQAYLRGRYFWAKDRPDMLRKAIEYFEQAIKIDSDYALAYSGLADSYSGLGNVRVGVQPPNEVMPQAKAAALKALELDEALAEAHASLASIRMRYDLDWSSAEKEYKRAIELNPTDARMHQWYASLLSARGRHDEAIAEIERAKELDPVSVVINSISGMLLFHARRYDEAATVFSKTLEMDPTYGHARGYLAAVYEQKGMFQQAIEAFKKNAETNREMNLQPLGHAYALAGKRAEAVAILDELKKLSKQRYVPAYFMAVVYTGLNDKAQAIEWLEKGYQERSGGLIFINVDPRFDVLRSESRFQDLLRRMGFAV
jgi:DNA-binding winged helix-turn-helix (wHTH) protein/TolB-like protein